MALIAAGLAVGVAMFGQPAGAHVAGWAHNFKKHIRPLADKRYLPSNHNTLTTGKTVKGTWSTEGINLATTSFASADLSFGWTFPARPETHVIRFGGAALPECPGTLANPKAKPGHLCVWESGSRSNAGVLETYDFTANDYNAASVVGTTILSRPALADVRFYTAGTWAATAGKKPASSALARPAAVCPADVEPAC